MSRLPFDPSKVPPPSDDGPSRSARRERRSFGHLGEAHELSVSELSGLIKTTLEARIPSPLRVIGQISNLSRANHWYFSLKDESAVIGCVAWASTARKFGFAPSEGDEVVATGHVSHYAPQGRTQFYVTRLEPVGAGALQLRFQAMCDELRALGYFLDERKKPLPPFPRRVAVITSATGAAVEDVIATCRQRCPAVGLLVVDVRVQGEGAAGEVARAVRWVDREHVRLGVDAIIVTRGGGSIEDLWAFNERVVADAVHACSVPLVAAIGHESDTTVIELVADLRAATPTQAVMRLVPDRDALLRQVQHGAGRLDAVVRRRLDAARERLSALARREVLRDPRGVLRLARAQVNASARDLRRVMAGRIARLRTAVEAAAGRLARLRPEGLLERRRARLSILRDRLERSTLVRLRERRGRLESLNRELDAIDPRRVLERGFSFTTNRRGELIRSVAQVRAGDELTTQVSDGAIRSVVGSARRRGGGPRSGPAPDQMDLFGSPQ